MSTLIAVVENNLGRTFRVFLCRHEKKESTVDFVDITSIPEGQHVSSYCVSTLLDIEQGCGLNLYGGEPVWYLTAENITEVKNILCDVDAIQDNSIDVTFNLNITLVPENDKAIPEGTIKWLMQKAINRAYKESLLSSENILASELVIKDVSISDLLYTATVSINYQNISADSNLICTASASENLYDAIEKYRLAGELLPTTAIGAIDLLVSIKEQKSNAKPNKAQQLLTTMQKEHNDGSISLTGDDFSAIIITPLSNGATLHITYYGAETLGLDNIKSAEMHFEGEIALLNEDDRYFFSELGIL